MTTALSRIHILAAAATIGLFGAASAPALSDDGFMAIHRDNQKAGSAVANYWQGPFGETDQFLRLAAERAFILELDRSQRAPEHWPATMMVMETRQLAGGALPSDIVPYTPALSDDGFMAIHMENQKIGSAVAANASLVASEANPAWLMCVPAKSIAEGAFWVRNLKGSVILKMDQDTRAIVQDIPAKMVYAEGEASIDLGGVWVTTPNFAGE